MRVWNPTSGVFVMNIPINYSATSMTWMNDSLFIGLDGGVIAIKFDSIQWPELAVCAVSAVLVIDISCLNLESGTPLSATAQCNHSRNAPNQGLWAQVNVFQGCVHEAPNRRSGAIRPALRGRLR